MKSIEFIGILLLEDLDRDVEVEYLDENADKFRVYKDFTCKFRDVSITVPAGYITDLSSTPRIIWWLYPPGLTYGRKPSVVHDYIYSTLYRKYPKEFADELYYEGLREMGMDKWKAKACYYMVRLFGNGGWERSKRL